MILENLQKDIYTAQKEKNALKLSVLRYLFSQIKNKEIELRAQGEQVTDEIVLQVLKKQIKQRNQTIDNARQANRQDIIDNETEELKILEDYYSTYSA